MLSMCGGSWERTYVAQRLVGAMTLQGKEHQWFHSVDTDGSMTGTKQRKEKNKWIGQFGY